MSSNEKMLLNVLPSILAADNYNNSRRECASVEWNEREEKFLEEERKEREKIFFFFFDEKDFVCKENFLISLSFEKRKRKKRRMDSWVEV